MIRFRDWSIRTKASAASAIFMACLIGVGAQSTVTTSRVKEGLSSLSRLLLPQQRIMVEVADEAIQTHVNIFRYVAWSNSGVKAENLRALANEIASGEKKVDSVLAILGARTDLNDRTRAAVISAQDKWARYTSTLTDTVDITAGNPPFGTMMLGINDEAYNKVAADLRAMTTAITASTEDLADGLTETAETGERMLYGAILLALALSFGVTLAVSRSVVNPLRKIGEVLLHLANGNKLVMIPYTDRGDEIGETARVANLFKDSLLRMERIEAEQKKAEERSVGERKVEMLRLADTFELTIGEIVKAVSSTAAELETAASALAQTAESAQQLTVVVASTAEQASTNVHSVSQATDEMSASTGEIARQVHESSNIASQAVHQARKTDGRMAELLGAASHIGNIVDLINAVAGQTNLLALNASIEAARAGEAGRGFAVVALEVKALALRTAGATQEISSQISGIQKATQDSVSSLQEIGGTIDRLAEIATAIAAAVEEQEATTQEISRNVKQAAEGTSQVASSILDVNRGASETGFASGGVHSSARALAAESNKLRMEAGKFLATVRAS
jgi:methyl-accepting chemotaxis protein